MLEYRIETCLSLAAAIVAAVLASWTCTSIKVETSSILRNVAGSLCFISGKGRRKISNHFHSFCPMVGPNVSVGVVVVLFCFFEREKPCRILFFLKFILMCMLVYHF